MEPSDVDRVSSAIVDGIVRGITHVASLAYEWYRKHTAPYYIPPPEPRNYEDQPQAVYPEMKQERNEVYRDAEYPPRTE